MSERLTPDMEAEIRRVLHEVAASDPLPWACDTDHNGDDYRVEDGGRSRVAMTITSEAAMLIAGAPTYLVALLHELDLMRADETARLMAGAEPHPDTERLDAMGRSWHNELRWSADRTDPHWRAYVVGSEGRGATLRDALDAALAQPEAS